MDAKLASSMFGIGSNHFVSFVKKDTIWTVSIIDASPLNRIVKVVSTKTLELELVKSVQ